MPYWEIAAGVVFGALGGWMLWASGRFPPGQGGTPGAGYFPSLLGMAMLGLGVALVLTALARKGPRERPRLDVTIWRVVLLAAMTELLVVVWRYLRFELASFMFLFVLSSFFEPRPWKENLRFSLVVTALLVVFFRYGLRVSM